MIIIHAVIHSRMNVHPHILRKALNVTASLCTKPWLHRSSGRAIVTEEVLTGVLTCPRTCPSCHARSVPLCPYTPAVKTL